MSLQAEEGREEALPKFRPVGRLSNNQFALSGGKRTSSWYVSHRLWHCGRGQVPKSPDSELSRTQKRGSDDRPLPPTTPGRSPRVLCQGCVQLTRQLSLPFFYADFVFLPPIKTGRCCESVSEHVRAFSPGTIPRNLLGGGAGLAIVEGEKN